MWPRRSWFREVDTTVPSGASDWSRVHGSGVGHSSRSDFQLVDDLVNAGNSADARQIATLHGGIRDLTGQCDQAILGGSDDGHGQVTFTGSQCSFDARQKFLVGGSGFFQIGVHGVVLRCKTRIALTEPASFREFRSSAPGDSVLNPLLSIHRRLG